MSPAIRVQQISKKYRLAPLRRSDRTWRQAVASSLTSRFRRQSEPDRSYKSRDFWALDDISFEVPAGEVLGIIGRNGAGKSTLLKILSQITEPTRGRIELNGRVASLLEVGTGFHPELSGRENIYLNGALLGMMRGEITRHFDEIVAFAEIGEFLDVPVKRYSSGMFVRLAFAVAAHLTSEILIIDEVLAVGDGGFQAKCLGKMRHVGASGRTVLFVSHDLAAVQALCDRVIMLHGGRIAGEGVPAVIAGMYSQTLFESGGQSSSSVTAENNCPEITKLALIDEAENEVHTVPFRSSPTLHCQFRSPIYIRDLSFNIQLMSDDGRLKSSITSSASRCPELCEAGQYDVRIELPNIACIPGRYFWSAQFWRPGEREPISTWTGLSPFEVTPVVLEGASRPYLRWAGEFHLESIIAVKKDSLESCNA